MISHLLDGSTAESYRRWVEAGTERVAARVAGAAGPFTGIAPHELEPEVRAVDLDLPLPDADAALDELDQIYLRDAVYFHHPRYLAHLNCPVALPALLGEAVLSAVNSSQDTWDQSAGATLIEQRLIAWTTQRIGFPAMDADGVFTSGGTQSNLQALLLARDEAVWRESADNALLSRAVASQAVLPRLRILASEYAHFSVVKSARLLGLGDASVISVPCDEQRRMHTLALQRELARVRADGLVPMAVVATAGTTDFGSIDPLPAIAGMCAQEAVWLHVDAAYGCGLLVSDRRRHLLAGIEYADSVTVDFHKSFFQPVSSSALIVRDHRTLRHVTYHADYLNPATSAAHRIPNQVDKSLQTTRRFDALKLWLTLRTMGARGVGELFDAVVDLSAASWRLLDDDPRFEVVVRPQLSTLVFRYVAARPVPAQLVDQANLHARAAVAARGEAMVAATVVDGRHYLKFTLLNPRTTLDDVAAVLDLLAGHAERYLSEQSATRLDTVAEPEAVVEPEYAYAYANAG